MITLRRAELGNLVTIERLARLIWPPTFKGILSLEQIEYMLTMMYSQKALQSQLTEKEHVFLIASENDADVGFVSYQLNYQNEASTKIHKIYLLPATQGKGFGKEMLKKVAAIAEKNGQSKLTLNVNRFNKAFDFYRKLGFMEVGQEDIDIGNGYLMQDFILELKLSNE